MNLMDKYKIQKEFKSVEDLEIAIEKAGSIKIMNQLRVSVITFIKTKPSLLKLWQNKYWSLKKCHACGQDI